MALAHPCGGLVMRTRSWTVGVLASLVLAAVAGCGGSSPSGSAATPGRGTIGIAMPTTKSARWIGDGANIKRQLELLGYGADLQYAEDDVDTQIKQLETMVGKHEKALVIGAIDGSKLK